MSMTSAPPPDGDKQTFAEWTSDIIATLDDRLEGSAIGANALRELQEEDAEARAVAADGQPIFRPLNRMSASEANAAIDDVLDLSEIAANADAELAAEAAVDE